MRNIGCTAESYARSSPWATEGGQGGGCGGFGNGAGGFELWNSIEGSAAGGTLGPTGETLTSSQCTDCSRCPCMQPLMVTGVLADERTLQLNVTWAPGFTEPPETGPSAPPRTLKYAWRDCPSPPRAAPRPAPSRAAPRPRRATIAPTRQAQALGLCSACHAHPQ